MSATESGESAALADARRDMEICNACRYCEGICAVFPAMERRREFTAGDLEQLAHLCHDCRGCFHACQYAPPHPFGVNVPRHFAQLRAESTAARAIPAAFGTTAGSGRLLAFAAAGATAGLVSLLIQLSPASFTAHVGPGAFYVVVPFALIVGIAGVLFVGALGALAAGVLGFWRDTGGGRPDRRALMAGLRDALTLRNLGGGTGEGCPYPEERASRARRHAHHALAGGFVLCFAATSVATIYQHVFGWIAPYRLLSLPVLLGSAGGVLMLVGGGALLALKVRADPAPAARETLGGEYGFLLLLLAVAATGLLLLALRATAAMGVVLAVHLELVLVLFVALPYGKFVHAGYRLAALVRDAMEKRGEAAG